MSLKDEKEALERKLADLKEAAELAEKRLAKLSKVQHIEEPSVGAVLRFSRPLGGGSRDYTFVAYRTISGWHVTGTRRVLENLLKLTDKFNTWEDLLIAIGDSKVEMAVLWNKLGEGSDGYEYFEKNDSRTLYRTRPGKEWSVEKYSRISHIWVPNGSLARSYLVANPTSWVPITKDKASRRIASLKEHLS